MLRLDDLAEDLFAFVSEVGAASSMAQLEQRYLDGIARFIPSSAVGIYALDPFTRGAESIAARGVSDFFLSRYEAFGRTRDPVFSAAMEEGRATHSGDLMTVEKWRGLPVYQDVFALHAMTGLLEAPIFSGGKPIGTLNFGRTSEEGPFTDEERRLAEAVSRLVGVAMGAHRESQALARERDQVFAALELGSEAVVVTDLHTLERRLNAAARDLLSQVKSTGGAIDELMTKPIRAGRDSCHQLPVTLIDGSSTVLVARSTHPRADELSITVSFLELVGGRPPRAAAGATVAEQLTDRQYDVARLAAGGLRDKEIAAQLHLSLYTVKQYLKVAYGKLGVRSRVELARLVAAED